jgi:hypothetical protein
MKPIDDYFVIKSEDLAWRPSNIMKIPNADFLERTGSEIFGRETLTVAAEKRKHAP